jgi:NitT/TauT family transport system substrate-binding protein
MNRRRFVFVVAVLALASAAAWASSQSEAARPKELQKVNFQLNWKITGDHAPYYVAMDKGWFAEEGIDVNIILGQGSGYTVQALESGKAEIGISGIKKPQDIAGKTVAVPAADGHKVMWPAFAKLIGVDPASVKFVNIEPSAKVAALASRKADVVFELYTGKPFMEKAIPPDQLGYFIWADYGFNAYAHSLIARDDVIKDKPDLVRKFLKAAYRAWDFTLKNPEEAIAILAKHHPINQDDFLANLKLVMDFFKTDRYRNYGIGYIDPERMKETIDLVRNYQGVAIPFAPEEMYTADLLPKPMYKYNW